MKPKRNLVSTTANMGINLKHYGADIAFEIFAMNRRARGGSLISLTVNSD